MSVRTTKKMRGFMCQSPAATAVCMATDSRSVVVPRRSSERSSILIDNKRFVINNAKYSRLVDRPPKLAVGTKKRSDSAPCKKREQDPEHRPNTLQKPSSIASSDNVFQVSLRRISLPLYIYTHTNINLCSSKCYKFT
jgi:hypothetical protein